MIESWLLMLTLIDKSLDRVLIHSMQILLIQKVLEDKAISDFIYRVDLAVTDLWQVQFQWIPAIFYKACDSYKERN